MHSAGQVAVHCALAEWQHCAQAAQQRQPLLRKEAHRLPFAHRSTSSLGRKHLRSWPVATNSRIFFHACASLCSRWRPQRQQRPAVPAAARRTPPSVLQTLKTSRYDSFSSLASLNGSAVAFACGHPSCCSLCSLCRHSRSSQSALEQCQRVVFGSQTCV